MLTIDLGRLPLGPDAVVLDLGCGGGRHAHALARAAHAHVVGVDQALADLHDAKAGFALDPTLTGWALAQADARRLPFPDRAFTCVVCSEVLEHIEDYQSALGEIARVCAPGGVLAVSVPRAWPEAVCWRLSEGYRTTPGGHVRIFNAEALRRDVEARGFRRRTRHWAHALHSPYWWLKCLWWDRREDHPIIRAYQRFLEWDLVRRPFVTRALEAFANPIMGKSVVMYFERVEAVR